MAELSARDRLAQTRGFVFDMDGTLVLGDRRNHGLNPLPGAIEMTDLLKRRGTPFTIFTNGTTRTPEAYAATLRQAGFDLEDEAMLTPASSAVAAFLRKGYKRVMVLGGEGVRKPLQQVGIEALPPEGRPEVDAVMVAWYREFTMECLEAAVHAVWNGASLYSASQALFFATAEGKSLGTSRAIAVMINDLTGARINNVGKPTLEALRCAGRRLGLPVRELAVVGDDPMLEVPMAHRGRAMAISVATGLAGPDAFDHLPPARKPHLQLDSVQDLLSLYRTL
jgi:4-nitrophenyl phosphatase